MDDTIFQLTVDGFFDPDDAIHCDACGARIRGQYWVIDDQNFCLKCVDGD
jgi:hypothetical protein